MARTSAPPFAPLLVLLLMVSAYAADQLSEFNFSNFTSPLPGIGNTVVNNSLIMTQSGSLMSGSSAWYAQMMQVRGFITQFTYTITNYTRIANQRPDGIAFVIQASSAGHSASGSAGSGIGYGAAGGNPSGILSSVAVEFDSWYNPELNDPSVFHIGVHSNGQNANNASEEYRIGDAFRNGAYDLNQQRVTITYNPILNGGTMTIQFNDQQELVVPGLDIEGLASLDPADGNAYIGFTAGSHNGSGAIVETIAVTQWRFEFLGHINATNSIVSLADSVVAGAGLNFIVQGVDQYNNSMIIDGAAGAQYMLTATLTEADGSVQNTSAIYSGSGKYVLNFNATRSGAAIIRVYLNNTLLIGDGDYPLTVVPASPFAPLSYPFGFTSGVSTPAVAGVTGSFFVQPRDAFGNNITIDVGPIVQATITNSGYSLQATGIYSPDFLCYIVSYNVTLAGNFTLLVTVNNQSTSNNSHLLQVLPAAVYPETSVLYAVNGSATAGVMQYAYLQLKDVFGNNISNSNVDVYIQAVQGNATVNGTVESCIEGLCIISYNLTVASYNTYYNIIVLVNGLAVVNSFATTVKVIPAALSPSVSYAYGQGITSGVAGELAYFYVQLTDVFGNNNSYPAAVVTTKLTAGSFETAPMPLPVSGGIYTFEYNVTLATVYSLTILVNGQEIYNSQHSVSISPNVVYPPNCEAFGSGISDNLVVGNNNSFYVQLRDEFYNNITTNGTETLLVVIESSALVVNASTEFNNGLYEVSYNIILASDYSVIITIDDVPILNAAENITLVPAAIDPLQSVATNVTEEVTAGTINQIQVQLRDMYGNQITNVPNHTGIVTASLTPQVAIDVTYVGSGVYTLAYNATVAGAYTLVIMVNGTAIYGGGQYAVQVAPAEAYIPFSVVTGEALQSSMAGQNSSFLIYLFDAFNNSITNPSPNDSPSVTISVEQSFNLTFNPTFNASIPAFVVTYNLTITADYMVTVRVAGDVVASSYLAVSPAPLSIVNSVAIGSDLAGATAGDAGVFTIYQRDQFGNVINNFGQVSTINVTMTMENTPQVVLIPIANADGSYRVSYNITVAGLYSTTILIDGVNIQGSPFRTAIKAAPFNPLGTETIGLSTSVFAGDINNFTIQLKDIWGNDVFDTSLPNPIIPGDISVTFNATSLEIVVTAIKDGVFEVAYNCSKAGAYWMSVTINGSEIGTRAPGMVVVQPNSVYPPACFAIGDATSEAIVKQTNEFTLVVRDAYGNDRMWSPSPPTIALTATGLSELRGSTVQNPDGTYLVNYFISQKTTYTMSVTFDGEHIEGSPFKVFTNYGNNSPSTVVIVCAVLGSVLVVAAIVAAFIYYRRRRTPYIAILE